MPTIDRSVSRYDLQRDDDTSLVDPEKLADVINQLIQANNQQEQYLTGFLNKFRRIGDVADDPV
jgi:hypothetical protein